MKKYKSLKFGQFENHFLLIEGEEDGNYICFTPYNYADKMKVPKDFITILKGDGRYIKKAVKTIKEKGNLPKQLDK